MKINLDGSCGYYSNGYACKNSGIKSLEDMRGKVFAFGNPNSTSGYPISSIETPQTAGKSTESGAYFCEVRLTGSYAQTIVAVV